MGPIEREKAIEIMKAADAIVNVDVGGALIGNAALPDRFAPGWRVVVTHEQAGGWRQDEQLAHRVIERMGIATRKIAAR